MLFSAYLVKESMVADQLLCRWLMVTGFRRKGGQVDELLSCHSVASLGTCEGLAMIDKKLENPRKVVTLRGICEAVAVPSYPQAGREITLGLAAQPTNAKTAVQTALLYLHVNYDYIKEVITRELQRPPYIDFKSRQRLNQHGIPFDQHQWRDMDLIFHIPPYWNVACLAPTMLIAILRMLWRLPPLKGWSVVGMFEPDGRVYAFPILSESYVQKAQRGDTLVVPAPNAAQIKTAVQENGLDLEAMGVKLIGVRNVMEIICWAVIGKDPNLVLG